MKIPVVLTVAFVVALAFVSPGAASPAVSALSEDRPTQDRPMSVDDLNRLEKLNLSQHPTWGESPNGEWFAFLRQRPRAGERRYPNYLGGPRRYDVWVSSTSGGEPVNITQGLADGAGYWNPVWSPDSGRLALFSTRGGLWVWERSASQLKQVSRREPGSQTAAPEWGKIAWMSNERLAAAVLPAGQRSPRDITSVEVAAQAMRGWERTAAGQEPGVNVLSSLEPPDLSQGELLSIDVMTGETRSLASGHFSDLIVSPDGSYIAMLEWGELAPQTTGDAPMSPASRSQKRLAVFSHDGRRLNVGAPEMTHWGDASPTISWAPDGRSVAILGRRGRRDRYELYVAQIVGDALAMRSVHQLVSPHAALDPDRISAFSWSAYGDLLLRGPARDGPAARLDWWRLRERGGVANLTAALPSPPRLLLTTLGGDAVGLADGKLWRMPRGAGAAVEIATGLRSIITSIDWGDPTRSNPAESALHVRGTLSQIVATTAEGSRHVVDLNSGRARPLSPPHPEAQLLSYSPRTGSAYFVADVRQGSYLWQVRPGEAPRTLVETNVFLRDRAESQARHIEYTGLDGRPLDAWILLPYNYQAGRKYPTVVYVYPFPQNGDRPDVRTQMNIDVFLNLQLLAARGYAVLLPSVSTDGPTLAGLSSGALPAINRAVELGYVDSERLGIIGASHGAFSTYALIGLPNPFKAAVAINGYTDYTSNAGTFIQRYRYFDFAHEQLPLHSNLPPWQASSLRGAYRSSPILYTDAVRTPLLIMHSDMDEFFPIEQAEQFFTALHQQNKLAEFVRYWGEGHAIDSPANIRDLWMRTVRWFDQYLDVSRDEAGELLWDVDRARPRAADTIARE